MSRVFPILIVLASAVAPGAATGALAAAPAYSIVNVGKYGGEPNIVSDSGGRLYISTPQGGTLTYRSDPAGVSWTKVATADPKSGDDCLATDQSGAVYLCNLNGSAETVPLQADVWKSTTRGASWTRGQAVARMGTTALCGTSCNPFGVDRDWVAASILPPYSTTDHAEVVLMYHDFYGPSQIWVHISTDGGATFGAAINVLAAPAFTPGPIAGTVIAQGYTMCNTIPAGVAIAPPGTPHPGRIFVAWNAADPTVSPTTGCNVTQAQPFHTLWVAWSDDGGKTWTPQQAFDAGFFRDASTPFVAFTLDNKGNPYLSFAVNRNSTPTCATETGQTLQSDTRCEYDMYLVWSNDGGSTWDGGGGFPVQGSAGTPYRINPLSETGTHVFPAIAAGDPGKVDVAYLRTPLIEPTDPLGKFMPGGCAGDGASQNPPQNPNLTPGFPGPCQWDLYAAQSTNLSAGPSAATWTVSNLTTPQPMHVGDICNLGIACVTPYPSNRNLLDYIQETLDPKGCAHITYADDNKVTLLRAVNQTAGCLPNSGGRTCHEGDGGGTFRGDHGDGEVRFDSDGCIDGDSDGVDSSNRGDGKDFHSTRVDTISLNSLGSTETITGVGTSGGLPVSFALVVVETTALTPGSVSLSLSDGFVNTGLLTSGVISLR